MKQRNPWLDTLKAFAIYLVILGHIINNCIINGYMNQGSVVFSILHMYLYFLS